MKNEDILKMFLDSSFMQNLEEMQKNLQQARTELEKVRDLLDASTYAEH